MSQKQAAVAQATAGGPGRGAAACRAPCWQGARLGQSTRRGASALLEAAGAARAAWRRWYSQLSIGGRLTKTRGWSGPPILQHALHEPPGLHVLVAGDPGLWLLDVLRQVAAEPFEGLDQLLEVLLSQPRQLAGCRRHFGGGIQLVLGLQPVDDALAPTPRGAPTLSCRRTGRLWRRWGDRGWQRSRRDPRGSVVETSFQSLQFHEAIFDTCLFLALLYGIPME